MIAIKELANELGCSYAKVRSCASKLGIFPTYDKMNGNRAYITDDEAMQVANMMADTTDRFTGAEMIDTVHTDIKNRSVCDDVCKDYDKDGENDHTHEETHHEHHHPHAHGHHHEPHRPHRDKFVLVKPDHPEYGNVEDGLNGCELIPVSMIRKAYVDMCTTERNIIVLHTYDPYRGPNHDWCYYIDVGPKYKDSEKNRRIMEHEMRKLQAMLNGDHPHHHHCEEHNDRSCSEERYQERGYHKKTKEHDPDERLGFSIVSDDPGGLQW